LTFFSPQNPGIGGLDELTPAEEAFLTSLAGLPYSEGDTLYYTGGFLTNLGIGSPGEGLVVNSGGTAPEWSTSVTEIAIGETIGSATEGSVLFAGVGGILAQDNANLFWDDTNDKLGLGTNSPASLLHIKGGNGGYDPTTRNLGLYFENGGSSDAFYIFEMSNGLEKIFSVANSGRTRVSSRLTSILDNQFEIGYNDSAFLGFFVDASSNVDITLNNTTDVMYFDGATGDVGINQTTPLAKLHIKDLTANTTTAIFENANTTIAPATIGGVELYNVTDSATLGENVIKSTFYDSVDEVDRFGGAIFFEQSGDWTGSGTSAKDSVMRFTTVRNGGIIEGLTITSDGDVGIHNPSPVSNLDLIGTMRVSGTGSYLAFKDDAGAFLSANPTFALILSSTVNQGQVSAYDDLILESVVGDVLIPTGNVGIGTTLPTEKFEVSDSDPVIRLTDTRNLTWTGGTQIGAIEYYSADPSFASVVAKIQAISSETSTGGYADGDLAFITREAGSVSEKMRILSTGNVGIGTDTPEQKVHLYNDFFTYMKIESNTSNAGVYLDSSNDSAIIFQRDGVSKFISGTNAGFNDSFIIGSSINVPYLLIDRSTGGRVGIGTGSDVPSAKLHLKPLQATEIVQIIEGVASQSADYLNINTVGATGGDVFTVQADGNVGIGVTTPATKLHIDGAFTVNELSADPTDPAEGSAVFWKSDGTGTGDDGDLLYMEQSASTVSTGSLKWKDFAPTTVTVNTGTIVTGDVTDTQVMFDGNELVVDEVTGVPGFDIEFAFTNVDRIPSFVVARWKYDGSATHWVTVDIWNYITTAWDELRVFSNSNAFFDSLTMYIPRVSNGNYVDGSGNSKVRFYHITSGNAAHDIHIDYVGLAHSLQGVV